MSGYWNYFVLQLSEYSIFRPVSKADDEKYLNVFGKEFLFPNLDQIYYSFHACIYSLSTLILCPAHQLYLQNTVIADLLREMFEILFSPVKVKKNANPLIFQKTDKTFDLS